MPKQSVPRDVRTIRAALVQIIRALDHLAPALTAAPETYTLPGPTRSAEVAGPMPWLHARAQTSPEVSGEKIRGAKGIRAAIAAAKRLAAS